MPRRVRPPRWLDLRLVLGVLLVLGSVLLGARVVSAADATVPVWSAAGDLAAGTVLAEADLVPVDVRLDEAAGAYLATTTRPEGRTLARAVRSGELLPRSALEEPAELVQLALPVQAGYVPPGLVRGQVVDVYAVSDPVAGARGDGAGVSQVVAAAPVQAVSGRSEGVLSTATTTVQVVVSVPPKEAPEVLEVIGGRPLVVVVHESPEAGGAAAAAADQPGAASTGQGSAPTGARDAAAPTPAPGSRASSASPSRSSSASPSRSGAATSSTPQRSEAAPASRSGSASKPTR
ncbi:SAF domain-containing protein [Geodermatophilus sp. SYSU D01105]